MSFFIGISLVVTGLYVLCLLLIALSWLAKKNTPREIQPSTKISIIIAARNEGKNIARCLQRIAMQRYPAKLAEVIVVDDHSEDTTVFEAEKSLVGFPFSSSVIQLTETGEKGKKAALRRGIDAAAGTLIVTIDADAVALHADWLSSIAAFYESSESVMIISPLCIDPASGFLNAFQELEQLALAVVTGGSAHAGKAILCNGANLAFDREAFYQVQGYSGNENIASGDDIFLLNKMQEKFHGRIHYLKSRSAIVSAQPADSFAHFIHQRLRWAGKFGANKNRFNFFLGLLVSGFNLLFVVFAALSCFFPQLAKYLLLIAAAKWLIDFLLVFLAALFFKRTLVTWWYPLAMLVNPLYVCLTALLSILLKPQWKGRKI